MDQSSVLHLISVYGPFILLPIMIVEGPIITIIASFLASMGVLPIFLVYILAYLGNVIGDVFYYCAGRFGRETFIKKYGKFIGLHDERVVRIEKHFKDHLFHTIFIAKITELLIVPTLIGAGIAKANFIKYLSLIGSIEIFKVLIVVLIGFYFGKFYTVIESYSKNAFLALTAVLVLFFLLVLLYKKLKKKS